MEVDEDSSAKITLELQTSTSTKAKGKRRSKQNIRRVKPLTSGIPGCSASATGLTDQQQLAACRALYQQLPKQSRYARHKLKVLDKAIELLSIQRYARRAAILHTNHHNKSVHGRPATWRAYAVCVTTLLLTITQYTTSHHPLQAPADGAAEHGAGPTAAKLEAELTDVKAA